ncbi:MAG TPA: Ig-like domain-containing protein, partial [Burkholderiaceae bacterium]|nr:Ig-like domain-containing protein [Burkholderiaceae bacterium]
MTASMHLHIARRGWAVVVIALAWLIALAAWPRPAQADPNMGPGGPILVVTQGTSNFGRYYAEILRNEGFNAFAVADIASVTPTMLTAYDVVILAKMPLTGTQVTTLSNWVSNGGNLIAMAPDAQLAGLLGLTSAGSTLSDGYLLVDSSSGAGNGIVNQTMQFHGTADRYTLSGAASVAALYNDATTSTANPAVTLRTFGSGHAAAFVYDLATSVVQSRQGNPAWAAQERDGFTPIRSDDKFFGGSVPDWINLSKVAIPQVDEQQRLLANLILQMNLAKKPLPRFWYFPFGKKAVVIMTGDDHGNGGTAGRFDRFKQLSPAGCSVQNWECVRGTSYMYPTTPLTDAQAQQYTVDGFEVGLHINTGCADFTPASLTTTYDQQMADWLAKYPSVGGLFTQRHHCIVWSDWATGAQVELSHGMRLDTSYYFWPPGWVNNTPGLFTGSAMPMRFMALDGTFIDVFMAASQMTDESGQTYPFTIDTLLDRAIGAQGYYGAYTINAHTDTADTPEAEAVVASAQARNVPVVSSKQMLTWLDARNDSAFSAISRNGGSLTFSVTRAPNAIGLQAMLPMWSPSGVLSSLKRGSTAVPFTQAVIKGIQYAFFSADAGTYVATYAADTSAPGVSSTSPAPGATGVALNASISATFSEAIDPATININTFELRGPNNSLVSASVGYDAASSTATLVPSTALAASTTYTAVLHGGSTDPRVKDLSGNALASNFTWSFTTAAGTTTPACPCSAWSSTTTPTNASVSDPNGV